MKISGILNKLGYSEKEILIIETLLTYDKKPASTIASLLGIDRTYCYKLLEGLVNDGLLMKMIVKGVKHYEVSPIDAVKLIIEKKQHEYTELYNAVDEAKVEINTFKSIHSFIPKRQIFDTKDSIERLYDAIFMQISTKKLLAIRFFVASTFSDSVQINDDFSLKHKAFIKKLSSNKIKIDGTIGSGMLLVDNASKTNSYDELMQLKPGIGTVHSYLVGHSMYILQFHHHTIGFKLTNPTVSDMMNFLLSK